MELCKSYEVKHKSLVCVVGYTGTRVTRVVRDGWIQMGKVMVGEDVFESARNAGVLLVTKMRILWLAIVHVV